MEEMHGFCDHLFTLTYYFQLLVNFREIIHLEFRRASCIYSSCKYDIK